MSNKRKSGQASHIRVINNQPVIDLGQGPVQGIPHGAVVAQTPDGTWQIDHAGLVVQGKDLPTAVDNLHRALAADPGQQAVDAMRGMAWTPTPEPDQRPVWQALEGDVDQGDEPADPWQPGQVSTCPRLFDHMVDKVWAAMANDGWELEAIAGALHAQLETRIMRERTARDRADGIG